jgi:hypothetical protein
LHFSHTANRESGNLTLSDCLNPGGVNVNTFCSQISSNKQVELDSLQVPHVRTGYLRHEKSLGDTSFAA